MEYSIRSGAAENINTQALILCAYSQPQKGDGASATSQAISQALNSGDFKGKCGDMLTLYAVPGIKAARVLVFGLGEQYKLDVQKIADAFGKLVKQLDASAATEATLAFPADLPAELSYPLARAMILAAEQATYRFDQCKSEAKPPETPLRKLGLLASEKALATSLRNALAHAQAMAAGINLAKDLSNLPGNICTPTHLADQAKAMAKSFAKLKVTVLNEAAMAKLKMGSLLSVSRGSRQEAKLIIMEYKGGKANSKPVVLVGKGLTFDAGGISLKPGANMDEMKFDMCGAASVFGTVQAVAQMNLPINLVGIVPSSENLPDGAANKPGDIVTSMAGLTIEILNTDAEGRLILCDALTYAARYKPEVVVDIATLTGACVVALGNHMSGLMANDDALADELLQAGKEAGDEAWRLPMGEKYMKQLDSNFADMANIGGPGGGSITAACFLSRFTEKYRWAHLDIAGTAWKSGAEKGATGRPVSMLTQMLLKRCGKA